MNISINIPSYKRPKVKTLEYLPFCQVWVDNGEYEDYVKANPQGTKIIECPDGVQGNSCRVRNYILDQEFERGMDAVLIIDDDMKGVFLWQGTKEIPYKDVRVEADDFMGFLEKYSEMCYDLGFKFWGCNCNTEPMSYRQITPFSFSAYIGGPFQCFLKNPLRYDERLPLKEDYDMTLQQCRKYRGCLRLNFAFYRCKQSEQSGGCATYRNREREKEQLEMLQKKWGGGIVRKDKSTRSKTIKTKIFEDYNPIIRVPIKGV